MKRIELWPEQLTLQADQIELGFVLEDGSQERQRFWYQLSADLQPALTDSCDPFVLPAVFIAMQRKANLVVHGQVSPSLLKNLSELQTAWASWRPDRYTPVEISADLERETPSKAQRAVLSSFSGGVDSLFTVWRHHTGLAGRQNRKIQSGLMVHGFDIRLNQPEVFARAAHKARKLLATVDTALLTMVTNLKKTGLVFEDAHGAILGSCLMLLQGSYSTGLIASSYPYTHLHFPWGSNPITDRLLSSASFEVVHDSAAITRIEKDRLLAGWPEAMNNLRVCVRGEERDQNCCRCEKCIRTILEFRALGLGLPPCFAHDVTDSQILRVSTLHSVYNYQLILETAEANHLSASWVWALKWAYFYNKSRVNFISSIKRSRRSRKAPLR
jgi:hypothetical protein